MSQQFQSGPGQSRRIPSEQLVFSLCRDPEEVHPSASERRPSNTTDELASDSESKQTKSKSYLLLCPFVWPGQDWPRFGVGLLNSCDLIKKITPRLAHTVERNGCSAFLRSSQSQCRQRSGCTLPSTVHSAAFSGSLIPRSFGSLLAVCLLKSI